MRMAPNDSEESAKLVRRIGKSSLLDPALASDPRVTAPSETGLYEYDHGWLVRQQVALLDKYERPETLQLEPGNPVPFVKTLDRYLMQTLEEIFEAQDALCGDTDTTAEYEAELIDVLLYLATAESLIWTASARLVPELDPFLELEQYRWPFSWRSRGASVDMQRDRLVLSAAAGDVFRARRMFPERKWHKPWYVKTSLENVNRLMIASSSLQSATRRVLSLFFAAQSPLALQPRVARKRQFVLDLPKPGVEPDGESGAR